MSRASSLTKSKEQSTGPRVRVRLPRHLAFLRYLLRPWVGVALILAFLMGWEMRTGRFQARLYSNLAKQTVYSVEKGPSPAVYFPSSGPYNERLGYARIPEFSRRLEDAGFAIDRQARVSGQFLTLTRLGFYPIYREKAAAGLEILARDGTRLHSALYPSRTYLTFESIPPLVVNTLLFIENREVLKPISVYQNPAVEWDRLAKAFLDLGISQIDPGYPVSGGSTLATQLEKIRYSPGGRTGGVQDKVRQMASASLRSYLEGEQTIEARRHIVLDYLNAVPLAAQAGWGEIYGFGDGLWAWYGTDFLEANELLSKPEDELTPEQRAKLPAVYRQTINLLVALKKPTDFLVRDQHALNARASAYLPLLAEAGIISPELSRDAEDIVPKTLGHAPARQVTPFYMRKGIDSIRSSLLTLLGSDTLYEVDHLDLKVRTTLDPAAADVSSALVRLHDPAEAAKAGLTGARLLSGQTSMDDVIYSFTLYERGDSVNRLRVQADNYNQPLSVNEGTKLELGSTSKLRTLVAYLEIISALRDQLAPMSPGQRRAEAARHSDPLTAWSVEYLNSAPDTTLLAMLNAALDRRYSANPGEGFYTGGGLHYFSNFDGKDNGRIVNVREALHKSINLPFIRLMRDVVRYYSHRLPYRIEDILSDPDDPTRQEFLNRFIDEESKVYLRRFYNKHFGLSTTESVEQLIGPYHAQTRRMAVIFRSVRSDASLAEFRDFLSQEVPRTIPLSDSEVEKLYSSYGPDKFNLNDRGYLARIHPLELFAVSYLRKNPQASFQELVDASVRERNEAYVWLRKTRYKGAQDKRILTLVEEQAFDGVFDAWKRQGFPFRTIVPSYATAIGSSGDNPAALAELVGILLNGGVRYPTRRINSLEFGDGTPFETRFVREQQKGERVYAPELARLVLQEMRGVVEQGTARRALGSVVLSDGTVVPVGGKTGTGDNRIEFFTSRGHLAGSQVRNRTATFVFFIGDRFYGTITAFVNGTQAGNYEFTSALPVQVFRHLAPVIRPVLEGRDEPDTRDLLLTKASNSPNAAPAQP